MCGLVAPYDLISSLYVNLAMPHSRLSSKCDFPTPPSAFNACQNACACNVSEPVFDVLANFLLTRID